LVQLFARSLWRRNQFQLGGLLCGGLERPLRRAKEIRRPHIAAEGRYGIELMEEGRLQCKDVSLRNALNEVLRNEYSKDCERGLLRWTKS
jgi:hypothetical protein